MAINEVPIPIICIMGIGTSLILSKVDHCHMSLWSQCNLDRVQSVLNADARLIVALTNTTLWRHFCRICIGCGFTTTHHRSSSCLPAWNLVPVWAQLSLSTASRSICCKLVYIHNSHKSLVRRPMTCNPILLTSRCFYVLFHLHFICYSALGPQVCY